MAEEGSDLGSNIAGEDTYYDFIANAAIYQIRLTVDRNETSAFLLVVCDRNRQNSC